MATFSIRRAFVASGLILGSTLLFAPGAKALTDGPDFGNSTGGVDQVSILKYNAPSNVTLSPTGGNANMSLGQVQLQNNTYAGWTLKVTSTNGGTFKDSVSGSAIPYTNLDATSDSTLLGNASNIFASATTNAVVFDPASSTLFNATTGKVDCGSSTGCTIDFVADVANTAIDGRPYGSYSDTLTFTLTSK